MANASNNPQTGVMRIKSVTAFRAGKKSIEVDGRKFLLIHQKRNVNATISGKTHRFKEEWLVVKPEDGFVPVYSFELKNNSRVGKVKVEPKPETPKRTVGQRKL
jgi:hypothetical protein